MNKVLTSEERSFYEDQGYAHLPGRIPADALQLARDVLERWVDETIAGWQAQRLINDSRRDLDFERRLVVVWNEAGRPGYVRSPRRDLVSPELFGFLTRALSGAGGCG